MVEITLRDIDIFVDIQGGRSIKGRRVSKVQAKELLLRFLKFIQEKGTSQVIIKEATVKESSNSSKWNKAQDKHEKDKFISTLEGEIRELKGS